jgi:hypothetical protein
MDVCAKDRCPPTFSSFLSSPSAHSAFLLFLANNLPCTRPPTFLCPPPSLSHLLRYAPVDRFTLPLQHSQLPSYPRHSPTIILFLSSLPQTPTLQSSLTTLFFTRSIQKRHYPLPLFFHTAFHLPSHFPTHNCFNCFDKRRTWTKRSK